MVERGHPARRPGAVAAVAVALAVSVVACGDATPVAPLPVRPPAPASTTTAGPTTPAATPPPSTSAPTVRRPPAALPAPTRIPATRTPSASPTALPSACLGAVRYDLVLAETELALIRSLCFAPGAVLRIIGIGPGEVTVDRQDLVSRSYEAGVVDIRFLRAGTVAVTIPQADALHTISVVVV
ncbi:hypothetical protein AB0C04_31940 [Micromonospora sp. NPDC048909]|uniref:hypothetical protein n=1 Tax=Micromonospora sp. NPDC048909 TaxID=3155643 RepID=UPI0033CE53B6